MYIYIYILSESVDGSTLWPWINQNMHACVYVCVCICACMYVCILLTGALMGRLFGRGLIKTCMLVSKYVCMSIAHISPRAHRWVDSLAMHQSKHACTYVCMYVCTCLTSLPGRIDGSTRWMVKTNMHLYIYMHA